MAYALNLSPTSWTASILPGAYRSPLGVTRFVLEIRPGLWFLARDALWFRSTPRSALDGQWVQKLLLSNGMWMLVRYWSSNCDDRYSEVINLGEEWCWVEDWVLCGGLDRQSRLVLVIGSCGDCGREGFWWFADGCGVCDGFAEDGLVILSF